MTTRGVLFSVLAGCVLAFFVVAPWAYILVAAGVAAVLLVGRLLFVASVSVVRELTARDRGF